MLEKLRFCTIALLSSMVLATLVIACDGDRPQGEEVTDCGDALNQLIEGGELGASSLSCPSGSISGCGLQTGGCGVSGVECRDGVWFATGTDCSTDCQTAGQDLFKSNGAATISCTDETATCSGGYECASFETFCESGVWQQTSTSAGCPASLPNAGDSCSAQCAPSNCEYDNPTNCGGAKVQLRCGIGGTWAVVSEGCAEDCYSRTTDLDCETSLTCGWVDPCDGSGGTCIKRGPKQHRCDEVVCPQGSTCVEEGANVNGAGNCDNSASLTAYCKVTT